jgi:hypothetical protein
VPIVNVVTATAANTTNTSTDSDVVRIISKPAPAPLLSPGGMAGALAALLAIAALRLRRERAARPRGHPMAP